MLSANFKPKWTAAASRGFLATAWLSCNTSVGWYYNTKIHSCCCIRPAFVCAIAFFFVMMYSKRFKTKSEVRKSVNSAPQCVYRLVRPILFHCWIADKSFASRYKNVHNFQTVVWEQFSVLLVTYSFIVFIANKQRTIFSAHRKAALLMRWRGWVC